MTYRTTGHAHSIHCCASFVLTTRTWRTPNKSIACTSNTPLCGYRTAACVMAPLPTDGRAACPDHANTGAKCSLTIETKTIRGKHALAKTYCTLYGRSEGQKFLQQKSCDGLHLEHVSEGKSSTQGSFSSNLSGSFSSFSSMLENLSSSISCFSISCSF